MTKKIPDKISEPDDKTKTKIYKLYKAIFESDLEKEHRIKLMTYIFAWNKWSWRVVGISEGAIDIIDKIKENMPYKKPKGLQRDHFLQGRKDTCKKMLEPPELLELNNWWDLFWKNDQTIIMTKEEHNRGKDEVNYHKLNWQDGYFSCESLIGFKCRKNFEVAYLENLKFDWVSIEEIKLDKKND